MPEEFEEELGVQQIVVHPEYRVDGSDCDIALVRLRGHGQCASLGSRVLPACLPLPRERPQRTASTCYVTGWGDTGKGRAGGDRGPAPAGRCLGPPHTPCPAVVNLNGFRPSCFEILLSVRCLCH